MSEKIIIPYSSERLAQVFLVFVGRARQRDQGSSEFHFGISLAAQADGFFDQGISVETCGRVGVLRHPLHAKATAGVECRKDEDVIDETPMAYKSIDAVMEAQRDLVDVVHTLRQVVCVKG